jgi:hypothetical protein
MQPTSPSERRSCGKTWEWSAVVEELQHWVRARPAHAPLLELSKLLAGSRSAPNLFPGVSYDGLLITNGPEFYRDDNVLFVTHYPDQRQFRLQYRLHGHIHSERLCSEADILLVLTAVLHDCYGITLDPAPKNG